MIYVYLYQHEFKYAEEKGSSPVELPNAVAKDSCPRISNFMLISMPGIGVFMHIENLFKNIEFATYLEMFDWHCIFL